MWILGMQGDYPGQSTHSCSLPFGESLCLPSLLSAAVGTLTFHTLQFRLQILWSLRDKRNFSVFHVPSIFPQQEDRYFCLFQSLFLIQCIFNQSTSDENRGENSQQTSMFTLTTTPCPISNCVSCLSVYHFSPMWLNTPSLKFMLTWDLPKTLRNTDLVDALS